MLGGQHQVAFVLAVFLVDQDHHPAGLHLGDDVLDRRDPHRGQLLFHVWAFSAVLPLNMRST